MFPAGKFICPYCANTMTRMFYRNDYEAAGAFLVRDENGHYAVKTGVPGSYNPDDASSVEYELCDDEERLWDGAPHMIRVRNRKSKDPNKAIFLEHGCPICQLFPKSFPASYGRTPIYVIAVVGGKASGKTSWLQAMAWQGNQVLMSAFRFPNAIIFEQQIVTLQTNEATKKQEQGYTNFLTLSKDGQDYATIILRDFAGELFDDKKIGAASDDVPLWDMLSYPDAFLFFADETEKEDPEKRERNIIGRDNTYQWLQKRCLQPRRDGGRPILGIVLSHADMMSGSDDPYMRTIAKPRKWGGMTAPYITENTFPRDTVESYTPENILPRIELEDMIARRCSNFVEIQRHTRWAQKSFIVKSCVPEMINGVEKQNYEGGINVYDPLIWVLNRLRLFPVR